MITARLDSMRQQAFLGPETHRVLSAFLTTLCLMGVMAAFFQPRWETNDDVGMSMVAHGYGLASYGSPYLLFSNVLWGHLVRALPSIGNTFGYSIASIMALFFAGSTIFYFLLRLKVSYLIATLAAIILLARPTIFPQFTLNAGLLTVAGVIGWHAYDQAEGLGLLISSCVMAFLGYLVRSQEFFLILFISLPFFPWRTLRTTRNFGIALALLWLTIAAASIVDHRAYRGPEWNAYLELDLARAPYTDFQAGEYVKKHADVLARHGYSENDIDLITDWFFADTKIANPAALRSMLSEAGWLAFRISNLSFGIKAERSLLNPALVPITVLGVLIFAIRPSWKIAMAFGLCVVAICVMGAIGRPALPRVWFPVMTLLVLELLIHSHPRATVPSLMLPLILFLALLLNFSILVPQYVVAKRAVEEVQRDAVVGSRESVVTWGAEFPFESAFPLYGGNRQLLNARFYALGVFTKAPFSVATADESSGDGLLKRLDSTEGIPFIASSQSMRLLQTYCHEHGARQLDEIQVTHMASARIRRVRCE